VQCSPNVVFVSLGGGAQWPCWHQHRSLSPCINKGLFASGAWCLVRCIERNIAYHSHPTHKPRDKTNLRLAGTREHPG